MGDHISIKHLIPVGLVAAATSLALASPAFATTTTALWHMDTTTCSAGMTDSSGNGHNGTINNCASGWSLGVTGESGTAFHTDGSNSNYISVPSASGLQPQSATLFQVDGWINTTHLPLALPADFDIARKGNASDSANWKMEVEQNSAGTGAQLNCGIKGTNGTKEVANTHVQTLSNGNWHHVTCAYGLNGNGQWELDADVDLTTSSVLFDAGTVTNSQPVIFANYGDGSTGHNFADQYIGKLDEFQIIKP